MNIQHFPNRDGPSWPWAYGFILALNAVVTAVIYLFLKKKNWL